jgi:hypothetical protein
MDNDGLQVAERAEEERGGEAIKPGDLVICWPERLRARVVRVSSAPRRSSDAELIPHPATIVTCEMPWGDHLDYWEDNLELVEPDPPGTCDMTSAFWVGRVIRHAGSGLCGRIESVTLRTIKTTDRVEEYRVFSVVLESEQHAVWWDCEIDA